MTPLTHDTIMIRIYPEFCICFYGKANGVYTGAAFCSDQRTNGLQVLQRNKFRYPGFYDRETKPATLLIL